MQVEPVLPFEVLSSTCCHMSNTEKNNPEPLNPEPLNDV
jgi:hypothetical protein